MWELIAHPQGTQPLSQAQQTQAVRMGCLRALSSDLNVHPDQAVPSWVLDPKQSPPLSPAPS